MKTSITLLIVALSLAGCGHSLPTSSIDMSIYPFSEGDAYRYSNEGRSCWAESNRAHWDLC